MASAPRDMPKTPPGIAGEIVGLVQSELSPDRIRAQIAEAQKTTREGYEKYRQISEQINADLIGLLRQGAQIDLDHSIEKLLEAELGAENERQRAEQAMTQLLRLAAKKRPDLLKTINEALAAELHDINRLAETHRDARWRLMEARALYQPSKGIGPVKGQHSDLEELLKN